MPVIGPMVVAVKFEPSVVVKRYASDDGEEEVLPAPAPAMICVFFPAPRTRKS